MSKKLDIKEFPSILVYSLNYIGDTLFTTPIYENLKKSNPNLKIFVIVGNRGGYYILKDNPYIDNLFVIKGNIKDKLKQIRENISDIPKISLILENNFESALICFLLGIKYRIGAKNECRSILLTHRTKKVENQHYVDKFFSNLCHFSNNFICNGIRFYINDKEINKEKFEPFMSAKYIKIGILTATTNINKQYSKENYIKLIELIFNNNKLKINKSNCVVYFIGGNDAEIYTNDIVEYFKCDNIITNNIINFVGKTVNLSELGFILKNMDIVIGADTGPLHIANSFNILTIFLFGPSSFKKTGPYNKENSFILTPKSSKNINEIAPEKIYDIIYNSVN